MKNKKYLKAGLVPLALTLLISNASVAQEKAKTPAELYTAYHEKTLSFDSSIKEVLDAKISEIDPAVTKVEDLDTYQRSLAKVKASIEELKEKILAETCEGESHFASEGIFTVSDPSDPALIFNCEKVLKLLVDTNLKVPLTKIEKINESIESIKEDISKRIADETANLEKVEVLLMLKTKVAEKDKEVKALHSEVEVLKMIKADEKRDLEAKANQLKSELMTLLGEANDIENYDGCEDDEKTIKDLINVSNNVNEETIELLARLDVEKEEVISDKDEETNALENIICKQENKIEELEKQINTLSQQAMQPALMQMMMNMMNQQLMMMSQFQLRPSVSDNFQMFAPMMMMQAMNNMTMSNNIGMMAMMGMVNNLGQKQSSLYVGGNMYSGDYNSLSSPTSDHLNTMNYGMPTMPFAYNLGTNDSDSRTEGEQDLASPDSSGEDLAELGV